MATPRILAIVLAGGEGKRLMPLTADRAKPAVPFGGMYRLVDFALSNLVNSRYLQIVVLTQYKSHSLDRHVAKTWRMSPLLGNYVAPVPAQQRVGKHWYLGSADAIYQCLNIIADERPDIVVVVGADHVYRMDFSQMVASHVESGAAFTRRGHPPADRAWPTSSASSRPSPTTATGSPAFLEKPTDPVGLPDAPHEILASMGNYVANADALIEAVTQDADNPTSRHDMGGDIVPWFVERGDGRRLRLRRERRRGLDRPGPRLLARRRDPRRLLRREHGPHLGQPGVQPVQRASGRCSAATRTCRRRSSCTPARAGSGTRRTPWSPPACSSPVRR